MKLYIEVHVQNDDGGTHAESLSMHDSEPGEGTAVAAAEEVHDMIVGLMAHKPHGAEGFVGYGTPERDWLN